MKVVRRLHPESWLIAGRLSDLDRLADFSFKLFSLARTVASLAVMLRPSSTLCSPTAVSGPVGCVFFTMCSQGSACSPHERTWKAPWENRKDTKCYVLLHIYIKQ